MFAKNTTINELEKVLAEVAKKYNNNLIFNRIEQTGRRVLFTLRVKDSSGSGARVSNSGRKMISACWHCHGDFFDELLKQNPKSEILSLGNKRIYKDSDGATIGNWEDISCGSQMYPSYMSELCNCN